jgi:hypothetical protein
MNRKENRLGVMTHMGWRITAVTVTYFEATKDGENVTLESDSMDGIVELIKMREEAIDDER